MPRVAWTPLGEEAHTASIVCEGILRSIDSDSAVGVPTRIRAVRQRLFLRQRGRCAQPAQRRWRRPWNTEWSGDVLYDHGLFQPQTPPGRDPQEFVIHAVAQSDADRERWMDAVSRACASAPPGARNAQGAGHELAARLLPCCRGRGQGPVQRRGQWRRAGGGWHGGRSIRFWQRHGGRQSWY